jgi:GTP-binding protein
VFDHYGPKETGAIAKRINGVMIANAPGTTPAYSLGRCRSAAACSPPKATSVRRPAVGIHSKDNDLTVNAIKPKPLTNMRASGKDDAIQLTRRSSTRWSRRWTSSRTTSWSKSPRRKSACARSS